MTLDMNGWSFYGMEGFENDKLNGFLNGLSAMNAFDVDVMCTGTVEYLLGIIIPVHYRNHI